MSDAVTADRTKLIRDHFEFQARGSEEVGSPFVAALCRLLAARLDDSTIFGKAIFEWPGDPKNDAMSLRVVGALHALVRSGKEPILAAAYPPAPFNADRLWAALAPAIARNSTALTAFLDSAPQTNEVARSGLILGGALHVARETGLPLEIFEFGSSAGLNLAFDEYRYDLGNGLAWGNPDAPVLIHCDWSGNLPPLDASLEVIARAGCDRRPLDPANPTDAERLMAYIWADQPYRLERTGAALRHAAANKRKVAAVDAGEWVETGLSRPPRPGACRMLVHTIVWQYMPKATQDRITAALAKAAAAATPETPIAHFAFEPDDIDGDGRMTLTLWPGGEPRILGRGHFHGRYAQWA
jgi:hypothetical protein